MLYNYVLFDFIQQNPEKLQHQCIKQFLRHYSNIQLTTLRNKKQQKQHWF